MAYLGSLQERIDASAVGGAAWDTVAANRRTDYSRGAWVNNSSGAVMTSVVFAGGAVTDAWLSGWIYVELLVITVTRKLMGLANSTHGTAGIGWGMTTAGNAVIIRSDDTVLATAATATFVAGNSYHVDLRIQSFGPSGTATLYVNGVQVATYTGDLRVAAITNLDRIHIWFASTSGADRVHHSENFAHTADTRPKNFCTLYVTAAGDANGWTSGTYADVDEASPINDVDLMSAASAALDAQLNLSNTPAGSFTCTDFIAKARCRTGAGAPTGIRLEVKSGGTISTSGATLVPGTSYATVEQITTVNPITGLAYTKAELDALQINLHSVT